MIGQTISHYRVVARIGAGGMGVVYRAHDEQLDRDVALKVLPAEALGDPAARARLLREARVASKLNHPHVCTIYEVGEADGQAYIAMELVEGETLSARLAGGPLPAEEVTRYGAQLADALAHAHERGVVHRDLKSANIVIARDGRAKVLDFGLATRASGEVAGPAARTETAVTAPGTIAGTVPYMAPEQLRGQPADARSDIWALGVVLYEMASGRRPFEAGTGADVICAIVGAPVPPLPQTLSGALRAVIERCLQKDAGRRYQNGGELGAALEITQSSVRVPQVVPLHRRLSRPGRVGVAVAVAVLGILGALMLAAALGDRAREGPRPTNAAARIQSLAVLPLQNLSGDPQQEYFADGITEALSTDLGQLTGLKRVIARGSVMRYKGTSKPLSEIARELRVDGLVTGAVLRSGDRVRITAQLVDGQTEEAIWAKNYERDMRDVLALQNEVTGAIARGIRLKLTAAEENRLTAARPVNPEAYDAYLKGRVHTAKASPQELETAITYFQAALAKDPNYARAYWGIDIVWTLSEQLGIVRPSVARPKASEALRKALELDPTLPEAHASLAGDKFYTDWDWQGAEKALREAIDLNPNYAGPRIWYAELLSATGRGEEGIVQMRRSLEFDPYNSLYQTLMGEAFLHARRYDDAIGQLREVARADPAMSLAHGLLQTAFESKGMYKEAFAEAKQVAMTAGDAEVADALDRGYARGGYRQAMRLWADIAAGRSKHAYAQATTLASLYAAAGEKDLAIEWLEKGYAERESDMVQLKGSPRWDILHGDGRYHDLLRRMNLE